MDYRRLAEQRRRKKAVMRASSILLVGGLAAGLLWGCGKKSSSPSGYEEATAGTRDIVTYRTFTGTIQPVTERNLFSETAGLKVTKVPVNKGDYVKEGDVICILDSASIEEKIKEKEATMDLTERQNALKIESAQQTYNNYKTNLDNDQNSQVLQAEQSIDTAFANLVSAEQAYNQEVTLNNKQLSSTILQAMNSVDSAYNQVRSAELALKQSKDKKNAYADDSVNGYSQYQANIDSNSLSVETAWVSYNDALKSYEAAKINEENSLTKLFDSYVTAQENYLNALDSYNSTVTQANQQLDSYDNSLQQAQVSADASVDELQLADLYRQLDDCTIKAPIDGVITTLNAKIGDAANSTTALATVTNYDEVKVQIKINEYDISGVEEGSPITITVDATNDVYDGTITYISKSATVENGVSYFTADCSFDGDENARGGMSVEAKLSINDERGVVAIPNSAVQTAEDGSAYILVPGSDAGSTENRPVTLGVTDGTYVQILEGLSEGETYYTPETVNDGLEITYEDDRGPAGGGEGGPGGGGPAGE